MESAKQRVKAAAAHKKEEKKAKEAEGGNLVNPQDCHQGFEKET